jgi:hypothetical protein
MAGIAEAAAICVTRARTFRRQVGQLVDARRCWDDDDVDDQ